jgi:FkbM family methyltransferase
MAFVLHYLRDTDRFVDVGANAGSYTVLAAGAVGAATLSLEPVPSTFERLIDNVNVNRLASLVECLNCAAGAEDGELAFSAGSDTMNHVLAADEPAARALRVPVRRLDDVVLRDRPVFLKIDVEGFEAAVIAGARALLASVDGMIIEMNGSSRRYGGDDTHLHAELVAAGLHACSYAPFERRLAPDTLRRPGNILYLRNVEAARERVRSGQRVSVLGRDI